MKRFFHVVVLLLASLSAFAQKNNIDHPSFSRLLLHDQEESFKFLLLFDNDGGVSGINSIPSYQCDASILPTVVLENFGSNELTSATLIYFIDGGNPSYLEWEGSLPPYFMDTIVLPMLNVDPGTHTLTIKVTEANGTADLNGLNNNSIQFNIVGTSTPAPYSEDFSSLQLPQGYFVLNQNGGSSWVVTTFTGNQNSPGCLLMPFYTNDVVGDEDYLYTKNVDLSNFSSAVLHFDVAYAYYSKFYFDELKVSASSDCGENWGVLYDKAKDDLATAPLTDVPFIPTADQWRNETIDLSSYSGFNNVLIRFDAISGHGNNLYIDNIGVDENLGVSELNNQSQLSVYPNPANDVVRISIPESISTNAKLSIINELGEQIMQLNSFPAHSITISTRNFPGGNYFVTMTVPNSLPLSERLTVLH